MRTQNSVHRRNTSSTVPTFYVSSGKQQLSLTRRGSYSTMAVATSETAPILISGHANVVVHARKKRNAPVEHSGFLPSTWVSLPGNAPASWSTRQSLEGTAGKKKGGSVVRRTQESDRIASPALAQIKVCSRAVLPRGSCPEHQATVRFLSLGPQPLLKATT
jgi:hypothetical protein